MIVLLEGVAPNQQTVVKVTVGKSQTLYSSVTRRGKDKNNGLISIGAVNIDIPQHPIALHGVMTRSSKQLSTTLQVKLNWIFDVPCANAIKFLPTLLCFCMTNVFCLSARN